MQFYPSRTQTLPVCGSFVSNQNPVHQPTQGCFCHHQLVRGGKSPHPPASHIPQMMSLQPPLSHLMPWKSHTALRGTANRDTTIPAWIPWVLPSWGTTSEPPEMLQAHFYNPHIIGSCTLGRAVSVCGLCLPCEPAQEHSREHFLTTICYFKEEISLIYTEGLVQIPGNTICSHTKRRAWQESGSFTGLGVLELNFATPTCSQRVTVNWPEAPKQD